MTAPRPEAQTLSVTEAAAIIGVSRDLAYDLIRRGEFPVPVLPIGRRYRVPRLPLERLVRGETVS